MSKIQKLIFYLGLGVVVLMILFPPWTLVYRISHYHNRDQISVTETPAQYRFIAFPRRTPGRIPASDAHLDILRLAIQLAVVAAVTAGLILLLSGRKMPTIDLAQVRKWLVLVVVPLILLATGVAVAYKIASIKRPIPLTPGANLEVKLANREPDDGLTPLKLEDNPIGTLYVYERAELTASDVAGVYMSQDQVDRPAIAVILTREGSRRMLSTSSSNIGRHVVIFVNGQAISAPTIGAPVSAKFLICGAKDTIDESFRALTQP